VLCVGSNLLPTSIVVIDLDQVARQATLRITKQFVAVFEPACCSAAGRCACSVMSVYGVSRPLSFKAFLTAGEVKNTINALATSGCLLPEPIPAT
jgi:hypothetical protein